MAHRFSLPALLATVAVAAKPGCPCFDVLRTEDIPIVTRGGEEYYPAAMKNYILHNGTYGASCQKHYEVGHADCTNLTTGIELAVRKDWCDKPWCYVDPCNCNMSDLGGGADSQYWLTGQGVHPFVAYSYETCATMVNSTSTVDHSYFDHAAFDSSEVCNVGCRCQSLPVNVPRIKNADGIEVIVAAKKDYYTFPGDFGASCKKHHETGDSRCYNLSTGEELPVGVRKSWCDEPWCFVDPCTCALADVAGGPSAAFKNSDGSEPIVGYSYNNCDKSTTVDSMNFGHAANFDKVAYCGKSHSLTCGHVKNFYRDSECCGQPMKNITRPAWR